MLVPHKPRSCEMIKANLTQTCSRSQPQELGPSNREAHSQSNMPLLRNAGDVSLLAEMHKRQRSSFTGRNVPCHYEFVGRLSTANQRFSMRHFKHWLRPSTHHTPPCRSPPLQPFLKALLRGFCNNATLPLFPPSCLLPSIHPPVLQPPGHPNTFWAKWGDAQGRRRTREASSMATSILEWSKDLLLCRRRHHLGGLCRKGRDWCYGGSSSGDQLQRAVPSI